MNNNEVYAAIALALHEHMGNNVHDVETGIRVEFYSKQ